MDQEEMSPKKLIPSSLNPPESSDNNNRQLPTGDINTTAIKPGKITLRNPKCSLCQNHGQVVGTKSHKRYCPWKECSCRKCEFVKYRRKLIAAQIADRRKVIEDKEREKTPETQSPRRIERPESSPPPPLPIKPTALHGPPVPVGYNYYIPGVQHDLWQASPPSGLSADWYGTRTSPWALAEDQLRQYSANNAIQTGNSYQEFPIYSFSNRLF